MKLVDGKKLAAELRADIAKQVSDIKSMGGSLVFAAVQVGEDPASNVYIETKRKNWGRGGQNSLR